MIKFENSKLTKEELNELIGGAENGAPGSGDINNINEVLGCKCKYLNKQEVINNTNKTTGCYCECTQKLFDEDVVIITNRLC